MFNIIIFLLGYTQSSGLKGYNIAGKPKNSVYSQSIELNLALEFMGLFIHPTS